MGLIVKDIVQDIIHNILHVVAFGTAKKTPPGGCSLARLKGLHALFGQGTVAAPIPAFPSPAFLVAHSAIFTFDGKGSFSGGDMSTVNGAIVLSTFSGAYTVEPDCTVLGVINVADGCTLHEAGTIAGAGMSREAHTIITDASWVFADTSKKLMARGKRRLSVRPELSSDRSQVSLPQIRQAPFFACSRRRVIGEPEVSYLKVFVTPD
jgi:hypothetical protein